MILIADIFISIFTFYSMPCKFSLNCYNVSLVLQILQYNI